MKILVLTSCGKAKRFTRKSQALGISELRTWQQVQEALQDSALAKLPAGRLYTGQQVTNISQAVSKLREKFPVDYYILSAGFGLVKDSVPLPNYNVSFTDMSLEEGTARAQMLGVHKDINNLGKYDLVFLALGIRYAKILENIDHIFDNAGLVVHFLRDLKNRGVYIPVDAGSVSRYSKKFTVHGSVGVKGDIIRELAKRLVNTEKIELIPKWIEEWTPGPNTQTKS